MPTLLPPPLGKGVIAAPTLLPPLGRTGGGLPALLPPLVQAPTMPPPTLSLYLPPTTNIGGGRLGISLVPPAAAVAAAAAADPDIGSPSHQVCLKEKICVDIHRVKILAKSTGTVPGTYRYRTVPYLLMYK